MLFDQYLTASAYIFFSLVSLLGKKRSGEARVAVRQLLSVQS